MKALTTGKTISQVVEDLLRVYLTPSTKGEPTTHRPTKDSVTSPTEEEQEEVSTTTDEEPTIHKAPTNRFRNHRTLE